MSYPGRALPIWKGGEKKFQNFLMLKTDMTLALSDKSVCQESSCTEGLNMQVQKKKPPLPE
jgi:hypothetical protein